MSPYLPLSISGALAGAGLLAFVAYRLGLPQAYIAYWSKASIATPPDVVGVSAKRAVYIHAAWAAAFMLGMVLAKAGWVFTKESLEAFNTFTYTFAGAYVLGKGLEFAGGKLAPKLSTPSTTEGAQ